MNTPRLTETLRAESQENWNACVQHRFVAELFAGSVDDAVMRRYLVQDYQFIDRFVALLGAAIASADCFASRVRLTRFAHMITSEENTYFLRAFEALGVPEAEYRLPQLAAPTRGFQALMAEAAATQDYASCLSVLIVAEWLYLCWADRPQAALPPRFEHAEWITLHNNAGFRDFVEWLRAELDRLAPDMDAAARTNSADFFARAVQLERQFFDHVY